MKMKYFYSSIILILYLSKSLYAIDYDNIIYKTQKISNITHQYESYLILGALSTNIYLGLTNQDTYSSEQMGWHKDIGNILTSLAISSTLFSLYGHFDDLIDFSDGITKTHIHALLGISAITLMLITANGYNKEHKDNALIAGSLAGISFITLYF